MKKFPIFYNESMEHPHENYHVRPFPQQPKRGGKELMEALQKLQGLLVEDVPNADQIREMQAHIHKTANTFNDDRLIDKLRMLSNGIDLFLGSPQKSVARDLEQQILKILVDLKHL